MELLIIVTDKDIEEHFICVTNPLEGDWNTIMPINVRLFNFSSWNSGVYIATIDKPIILRKPEICLKDERKSFIIQWIMKFSALQTVSKEAAICSFCSSVVGSLITEGATWYQEFLNSWHNLCNVLSPIPKRLETSLMDDLLPVNLRMNNYLKQLFDNVKLFSTVTTRMIRCVPLMLFLETLYGYQQ
jgi:hypothetical protein